MFFSHFVSFGFLIPSFSAFPCFFASPLFPACLLACFSAFCVFLLFCFCLSASSLLCFFEFLLLCFCFFLLLCLSASPLFCFSLLFCFSSFPASLLSAFLCLPAFMLFRAFFCFSYCRYPKKHHATHKPYEAALTKSI